MNNIRQISQRQRAIVGQPARPADNRSSDARESSQFERLLESVEVVSFDLFDTLVHRAGLFSPKDMFYRVQQLGERRLGLRLPDFAEARVHAEERARVHAYGRGLQETTLDAIYRELERILKLDRAAVRDLQEIELACERATLTDLESGRRLFDAAIAAGKRVVIVSDTYFDETFIAEIARQHGYGAAAKIFVSSAHGKSKVEGGLYDVVLAELGCRPSRVLHVGDNQLADVTAALGRGLRAFYVPTAKHRLKWRHGLGDQPSGNLVMSTMLYDLSRTAEAPAESAQPVIRQTAIQNISLLFFGYAAWLLEQLRNGHYRRVYFAARDGLIMKRCFELVARAAGFEIDARYLYISRMALYPTLVFTDPSTARRLFAHSWDHLTIEDALRRIALEFEDCADILAKYGLANRRMRLNHTTAQQFQRFLDDAWPLLERKYQSHYELTVDYLRQEGLLDGEPTALVDVGWHGTLQSSLIKLLEHLAIGKQLDGYYLGTFEQPADTSKRVRARGYLVERGEPAAIAQLVRSGPSVIELFHGAGHGSVLGYRRGDARVEPVLQHDPVEEQQFRSIIEPLQRYALEFIAEQLSQQPGVPIRAPSAGLVARAGLRPIYAPTAAEADVFGRLQIASDFGGRMKSITGALEWDLAAVEGDLLPDGVVPIWRPGFQALKKRG